MDKRGQVVKYMIALIIAVIVIWVIITIFMQKTGEAGKGLTDISKQAKMNASKCESFIFGRSCNKYSCEEGFERVYGSFADCTFDEVCCERT